MTPTQQKVLAFIHNWQAEKRYSPSLHDIATHCLQSPYANAASKHVNALCGLGFLEKDPIGRIKFWKPIKLDCYSMA